VHLNKEPYDIYVGRHSDPIIGKRGNPCTHKINFIKINK